MLRIVVMAAGQSSRMGRDKLALPWGGRTVLAQVLGNILFALARLPKSGEADKPAVDLIVVASKPPEEYLPANLIARFKEAGGIWWQVSPGGTLAENISVGLVGLTPDISGICFVPGNQVGLRARPLGLLLRRFFASMPDFLVPASEAALGSPAIVHRKYVLELLSLTGDSGVGTVLRRHPERWELFKVDHNFCNVIDTWEDYGRLYQARKLQGAGTLAETETAAASFEGCQTCRRESLPRRRARLPIRIP
ncbi:MAG TPA: NTP transferase domain-containing protein [Verrucomicrobiae bacterium]|nr:NTP transferase domain-containing protein [Verrucomicrobiae bacterium]